MAKPPGIRAFMFASMMLVLEAEDAARNRMKQGR